MADFGVDDLRLAAFAEREGRLLGRRRRSSLPPPTDCCAESSPVPGSIWRRKLRKKHAGCVVLEEIIKSALFQLHSVEDSLAFWDSKAETTHPRKMYYMAFERGPKGLAEMTCQAFWQLKNPYKFVLDSAYGMDQLIAQRMDALTDVQNCLAAFLAEIFSKVEKSSVDSDENSDFPLLTLAKIGNSLYQTLGPALKSVVSKDPGEFGMVELVDLESSEWTMDMSMHVISLIYKNVQIFDNAISSELLLHGKPRHVSMYWLPYSCGTIAFMGCSIWLLRNGSLEGTKQILTGIWNKRVKRPVISIRDELTGSLTGEDNLGNQRKEVNMMKDSLMRQYREFFKNTTNQPPSDLSEDDLLKHVFESNEQRLAAADSRFKVVNTLSLALDADLYRALLIKVDKHALRFQQELLRVCQFIKEHGLNLAILEVLPALGCFVVLARLAHSYVRGALRARAQTQKTTVALLLTTIEIDISTLAMLDEEGEHHGESGILGMMISKIDNLLTAIEPSARKFREWKWLRKDLIELARPQTSHVRRGKILHRLQFGYQSLRVGAPNAMTGE
ncbi:hypothetical protein QYE76_044292 [Lolium multiflorum]|uniref:Uncharacterized protein n=1 Tax=Lolium multiflorum TaxID=4521 RepID=A0AAD8TKN7_LOLMU|nr:hypothetical protein QYE76_044292 [Lolium multiflorum]